MNALICARFLDQGFFSVAMEPFLEENSSLDHAAVCQHAQALRGCREIALRLWSTYPQTHQLWTSPLAMCEISPIYEAPSFTWADRADEQDEQLRMLQNMERDLSKAAQEAEAGSSQPPELPLLDAESLIITIND